MLTLCIHGRHSGFLSFWDWRFLNDMICFILLLVCCWMVFRLRMGINIRPWGEVASDCIQPPPPAIFLEHGIEIQDMTIWRRDDV